MAKSGGELTPDERNNTEDLQAFVRGMLTRRGVSVRFDVRPDADGKFQYEPTEVAAGGIVLHRHLPVVDTEVGQEA